MIKQIMSDGFCNFFQALLKQDALRLSNYHQDYSGLLHGQNKKKSLMKHDKKTNCLNVI